jgi:ABC-type glutathione transport system ATPase component
MAAENQTALLSVQNLAMARADAVPVLQDVSFDVRPGEVLVVLGESGSGKSQLLLSLLRLAMPGARYGGAAQFDGVSLLDAKEQQLRSIRGARIGMLFQDPMLALNPCMQLGAQLIEGLQLHRGVGRQAALQAAQAALVSMGLPDPALHLRQYPHELSGGMRQRVMLAMAVLPRPQLLLADEPTTALDLITQAQVLDLLLQLRDERGMAIVLVTHDIGVAARIADRVLVLRAGQVIEQGAVEQVLCAPAHAYTAELLAAARQMHRSSRAAS